MATRTPRASQSSIAASNPAAVLSFTQPAQTAAASYYKIAPDNQITFGWNFTYLLATPTHLTVSAFCASNGNTYPVGPTDGIIDGAATEVVWDPYQWEQDAQTMRLGQAEYTLMICDERGFGAGIQAGYLTPNSGMKFSLYRPRPYVPLENWSCEGCSSASKMAAIPRAMPIAFLLTMMIMLLSGWSLFRRNAH